MIIATRATATFIAACLVFGLAACEPEPAETPVAEQTPPRPYSETRPVEEMALAMKVIAHLDRGNWELAAKEFEDDADLPDAATLERLWADLESKHGEYVQVADYQGKRGDETDTVYLTLEFEKEGVDMVFEIQDDKVIAFTGSGAE